MSPSRTRSASAAPTGLSSCAASEAAPAHAWLNPRPSRIERRLRLGAALASLLAAAALALSGNPAALSLAVALALGAAWTLRSQGVGGEQLRINPEGRLELGDEAAPEAARAQFVSPHLVVLVSASHSLAVWPDALPAASFRRLCALARWAGGQPPN